MSIGTHHYLTNDVEMKLCIQKALSQSSEHIKKNLQNQCKLVMNRYQSDISYRHEELGNDLYQLFKKIEPYNEIAQKLLCQYKPCQKLGYLLKTINSCLENIFAFLKTHTQQRKNYTEQKLRSLQQKLQIQVQGHCNRCKKFILSRDIQQTKVLIGVGQFNDPYNLYEAGTSDFINNNRVKQQDEQYRLKYAEVWQNKKKIQEKFRMMQLQFDKRSYGYTYSANQIFKLQSVIKNIISQGPNFEDQQYKTSNSFNGQVVKLVNKIYKKLKQYKQPDLYRDQQVQAGESEQMKIWQDLKSNNQKLTKKNAQMKKKLTQREKQISQANTKFTRLEQQYSRCIFQRNTNQQVMKNLVAQHVEAEKQIYQFNFDIKVKQEKIIQLERQNQCLRSDIQKWLHHIQEKTGDRDRTKPLKSLKSLMSKNIIAQNNTDEGPQGKSPLISEKQYGSHDRQSKRSSMLKRPVKKSISQLSSQNKDQNGQHSRRINKKLTEILEQNMASQRGETQYQDGINEGTQVSIKMNEENSNDQYKKDDIQDSMFGHSTKKIRQQKSLKKIIRKSLKRQQITNRSEVTNESSQKICSIKVQQPIKTKDNKESHSKSKSKSKSKQNSISKQSKQIKSSKTPKQLKQKFGASNKKQPEGLKTKIQKMGKKFPQNKQRQLDIPQQSDQREQYIHEQGTAEIEDTQQQYQRKGQKSNSIYQCQRKLTKKSTKLRHVDEKKSINSMHTSGPTFQPISSLNINSVGHSRQTQPQSNNYHTLFAQTLPDINQSQNIYTRGDKSKTLNQCVSNEGNRNIQHKKSLQQFQTQQIYKKLYKYYTFQLQFYSQQAQQQQTQNNQQISPKQLPYTSLSLQQFSTKIQNYIRYLIKQSLNNCNQIDPQQQALNPYSNLNRSLKISKFSSLSASIHNYQNMLSNIGQQCYNQINNKLDSQSINQGDIYRNKKQSILSSYSNVNVNNGHKRKKKDSIMIIQKLTQKLTKLFFSQQQAYQIQKSKFSSLHNSNTIAYSPSIANPNLNLNSSITMIKQPKKQMRHITPSVQLNQLLSRYQINYLKLTMILFVKLHNKYPQIYEIIKRNIMFPYSSNRCVVAVMGGTGTGIGGMSNSVSSYVGMNKMQRKTIGSKQLEQLTSTVNGYGCGSNYMRQAVLKLIVLHRKCLNCNNIKKNSTSSYNNRGVSEGRGTSNTTHHCIDKDNIKGRDSVNSKFNGQLRNSKHICKHLLDFQRFIEQEFQLSYQVTEECKENQECTNKENDEVQRVIEKLENKDNNQDNNKLEIKGKNQFSKR